MKEPEKTRTEGRPSAGVNPAGRYAMSFYTNMRTDFLTCQCRLNEHSKRQKPSCRSTEATWAASTLSALKEYLRCHLGITIIKPVILIKSLLLKDHTQI